MIAAFTPDHPLVREFHLVYGVILPTLVFAVFVISWLSVYGTAWVRDKLRARQQRRQREAEAAAEDEDEPAPRPVGTTTDHHLIYKSVHDDALHSVEPRTYPPVTPLLTWLIKTPAGSLGHEHLGRRVATDHAAGTLAAIGHHCDGARLYLDTDDGLQEIDIDPAELVGVGPWRHL